MPIVSYGHLRQGGHSLSPPAERKRKISVRSILVQQMDICSIEFYLVKWTEIVSIFVRLIAQTILHFWETYFSINF